MSKSKYYDVIIIGAGPGGLYAAYELGKCHGVRVAVIEAGKPLAERSCPAKLREDGKCVNCKTCSIMQGFGGAGAFSDGKFNITNDFGGDLHEYLGEERAIELMEYVDEVNQQFGAEGTKLYDNRSSDFRTICTQNKLKLLSAQVRHLGTDINYEILYNMYAHLRDRVDFLFHNKVIDVIPAKDRNDYTKVVVQGIDEPFECQKLIIAVGRSGSKWVEQLCEQLNIYTLSNHVDIGVRVELPSCIFDHITDKLYESKIVYRTEKYEDDVRTFCMNPHGEVVNENTNGIVTVNGHSYSEDSDERTDNTNFALLVSKSFTAPFTDSNGYGESIARLSNMLGGGVIVQRFGDLIRGRRSNQQRIQENSVKPTLTATPGDLSLVLPKRILDDIVEMIYALDKVAKGTANDDTLLYGVEVKFYNTRVEVDHNLETIYKGIYIIGDGSGVTHSLAHAAASGIHAARHCVSIPTNS